MSAFVLLIKESVAFGS